MIHFINAIATALINEGYKDTPMHVQQIPQFFERPSFLISYVAGDKEEVGYNVHVDNMTFQVVYFCPVNEYDYTDTIQQLEEITRIKMAFSRGSIPLDKNNRYAKITSLRANIQDGEIYVDLDLSIYNYSPIAEAQFELAGELVYTQNN